MHTDTAHPVEAPKPPRWLVGAGLWLLTPLLPLGAPPAAASLAHFFLFVPLVAVPLALRLLGHRVAPRVEPIAALLVLASFCLPVGPLAGALAASWVLFAAVAAAEGVRRAPLSQVAAHVFLVIGAVWLVLSRLGVGPRDFTPQTVLLATVHFHFSGFLVQVLITALGKRFRALAVAPLVALPLIAAGNLAQVPGLKFAGVALMVLGTCALGVVTAVVARRRSGLLLLSSASLGAGMLLAGVYGVGELTGHAWLTVPQMLISHAVLNALGFSLFGLLGHLRARAKEVTW